MIMTPIETYKLYTALHNHFTTDYDYFRYNGKTRASASSFEKRRDKWHLAKLGKHPDPKGLMVSNFIKNEIHWAGDLLTDDAKANYHSWKVRNDSLAYTFKEDIKKLNDDFNTNFIIDVQWNDHPLVIYLYQKEQITPETLCILMRITGCAKSWEKKLHDLDPIWEDIKLLSEKYTPFINYDLESFKKICLTRFQQ